MNNLFKEIAALPGQATVVEPRIWKRFLVRNAVIYACTNICFNSMIPYFSFEQPAAVHLFKGAYSIARFLLPLAFIIPLLTTIDTCNKMRALFQKRATCFSFPEGFRYNRFLLKQSLLNGSLTFGLTFVVMTALLLAMPEGYTYNGLGASILMGIYAGALALYFMMRAINGFLKIK
ncbi:hypothetical protein [Niabella aurantiaca]|uniref:hypothetical protein n=1 Tax=Niabella aurantiaca TaxID=379900 RepID=UPI0003A68D34|nr:hypothetical protein [Niabella aurantiaca]